MHQSQPANELGSHISDQLSSSVETHPGLRSSPAPYLSYIDPDLDEEEEEEEEDDFYNSYYSYAALSKLSSPDSKSTPKNKKKKQDQSSTPAYCPSYIDSGSEEGEEENEDTLTEPTNTEPSPYRYGNYYSGYKGYGGYGSNGYGSRNVSSELDSPPSSKSALKAKKVEQDRLLTSTRYSHTNPGSDDEEEPPVKQNTGSSWSSYGYGGHYYGGYGRGYGSHYYGGYGRGHGCGEYYGYRGDPDTRTQTRTKPDRRDTVYDDRQNVHVESIKDTITKSVNNLKTDPEPDFDSTIDQILWSDMSDGTKQRLIEFCDNTTKHGTGLTLSQLVVYVWQRICNPGEVDGITADERSIELIRILEERVRDCFDERGNEVCFAGRFSRIVSTLDGFFPDIRIGISDNERITAIVLQVKDSLKPYDSTAHISSATTALTEAGFEYDQFKAWIDEIESASKSDSDGTRSDSDTGSNTGSDTDSD